ncbi:MAG: flagellar protein [Lachnospiraceae bacterium]|jgi:flagellar operon protein|nr:TIGR02530 family flagellar biosynthesis protein [uncultured Acetatifactor sp.]MCI9220317.1 flagellar protein [Lachnospiraceae bacterium]
MDIQNNGYMSIAQLTDQYLGKPKRIPVRETKDGLTFQDVLQRKTQSGACDLKFSKHAMGRLADRNIELNDSQLERLASGTRKAQQKGIRDSLVIVDSLAFIVNVPNQTVVTAMDSAQTDENIFTNINGAVIM